YAYYLIKVYTSYAIVLGGGIGSRMASPIPKQLMILKGLPVIMHSIKAFYDHHPQTTIVLVLHPDYIDQWPEICSEHKFTIPHSIVAGGKTRFHSVWNALQFIRNDKVFSADEDPLIAIHDGVRPLVTSRIIEDGYQTALRS